MMHQIELISHPLCPFNQRLVGTLQAKGYESGKDFKITYVDLAELPAWFLALSPTKSMPLAKVNNTTILFKAPVIAEFLDEITEGSSLLPTNALEKARDRYWLDYASMPLNATRDIYIAKDEIGVEKAISAFFAQLKPIEDTLNSTKFWRSDTHLSLVDITYAPLFTLSMHFDFIKYHPDWEKLPKTKSWAHHLLEDPSVQSAICPNYAGEFAHFFKIFNSHFPVYSTKKV
jgi:glutathione S-transferase